MTALAPTLESFFTDAADPPAPGQPAHHRRPTGTPSGCCWLLPRQQPAKPPPGWTGRPGRAGRSPPSWITSRPTGQRRPHPQRPPRRDPLPVPLRRPAPPRARRRHRSGSWPSRPSAPSKRHLSFLTANEAGALLAAPDRATLERQARPCPADARPPDRAAGLRADRPGLPRRGSRRRRPRPLRGQGPQGAGTSLSPPRPSTCCGPGWQNARASHAIRCSRPGPGQAAQPRRHRAARSPSTRPPRPSAARRCRPRGLHPHVLRHSCAMSLLQARVDVAVLALWLGHADIRSTDVYVHADLSIKERRSRAPPQPPPTRALQATGPGLLAFLESL